MNEPKLVAQSDQLAVRTLLERLRQHRLDQNWSQAEMARRAGLSRPAYQNFENGYGNITLANLVRILGVHGFTANLAELVPPVTTEPTLESLLKPARQRARARAPKNPKPPSAP